MEIENYTIPRVIGVKQAAAEFGIAEHALRAWIRAGQLPVIQCGRKHLINCTVLSRFLSGELLPETKEPEQVQPAAVGADGTLYKKAPGRTARNSKGRLYNVMPAIR